MLWLLVSFGVVFISVDLLFLTCFALCGCVFVVGVCCSARLIVGWFDVVSWFLLCIAVFCCLL